MKLFIYTMTFGSLLLLISACTSWQWNTHDEKAGVCRELKSKMMFNGNTSNIRNAEIANSQNALIQRQYHTERCE